MNSCGEKEETKSNFFRDLKCEQNKTKIDWNVGK